MTSQYDVIIVGGGPAGASAAFTLGQAGQRVLLLEKERLPRYKTCGGAVSERMLRQFPFSFEPVIQSRVGAISYALGSEAVTIPLADDSLCMVMRSEFDDYLLQHVDAELRDASRVSAVDEQHDGVRVTTAGGERIEARYLIAADGANSSIARMLGLRKRRRLAGAIEIEAQVPPDVLRRFSGTPMLIFGEIGVGYLWIFPKADHLSIGAGALDPRPGDLQAALERVMKRHGIPIAGQARHGHPLPIFHPSGRLGTQRVLLAGDAAGLVDPFTGEGIRFAIQSGRLAAEAILAGRTAGYTWRIERHIELSHRIGAALTAPFYGMPRLSFDLALRNPGLSRGLIRMVGGQIGYGGLIGEILASFPGFLLGRSRMPGAGNLAG